MLKKLIITTILVSSSLVSAQEIIIHDSPREQDLSPNNYNYEYNNAPDTRYSSLEVRILQLEEKLRESIGNFEELNHKINQLEKLITLLEKDLKRTNVKEKIKQADNKDTASNSNIDKKKNNNDISPDILYKHSYKLLKNKKYGEAAESFSKFIKKFHDDKLTSNAYYWLGESFYVRGDYKNASLNFLKGYNQNKEGNKAPDNLLKLAMSLNLLGKKDDACDIFLQLESSFEKISPAIKKRIQHEQKKSGCI